MKKKICLLYGGKSAEHEVSLQTAKAVIQALDHEKYDIYPIFITTEGDWIKGPLLTGPVETVKQLEFRDGKKMAPMRCQPLYRVKKAAMTSFFRCCTGQTGKTAPYRACLNC